MLYVCVCITGDRQLHKRRMVFVAVGVETVVAAFSTGCGPQLGAASSVSRGPAWTRVASARPAMVPPAVSSAGVRTAAFICRHLLPMSAMPVDAVQDVVSETFALGACLSRLPSDSMRTVPQRSAGRRPGSGVIYGGEGGLRTPPIL